MGEVAAQLAAAAEQLRPLGMSSGYHNHQSEWKPVEGKRPMDVLAADTPKDVVLQFDVGTCVEVGEDPVVWIKANPGRIRSVHCKDSGKGDGRGYAVAFGEGDSPGRPSLRPWNLSAVSNTTWSSRRLRGLKETLRWPRSAWTTGRSCGREGRLGYVALLAFSSQLIADG